MEGRNKEEYGNTYYGRYQTLRNERDFCQIVFKKIRKF